MGIYRRKDSPYYWYSFHKAAGLLCPPDRDEARGNPQPQMVGHGLYDELNQSEALESG